MAFMLVFATISLPFSVADEPWDAAEVTEFIRLPEGVMTQNLEIGATEEDIFFPSTLPAIISVGEEEEEEELEELEEKEELEELEELEEQEADNKEGIEELEEIDTEQIEEPESTEEKSSNSESLAESDNPTGSDTPLGQPDSSEGGAPSGDVNHEVNDIPQEEPEAEPVAEPEVETPVTEPAPEETTVTEPEPVPEPVPEEASQEEAPSDTSEPASEPAPEPAAEPEPVAEPAPAAEPEPAPAAEPAPSSEGIDIGAFFLNKLFPARTANAEAQTKEVDIPVDNWRLDIARSSMPVFEATIIGGTYVYVPELISDYPIKAELPTITVVIGQDEEILVAFSDSVTIDGVVISLEAEEGVFPEGSSLFARKLTEGEEANVETLVNQGQEPENVMADYAFDIKVLDKEANEIQPDTSKGRVRLSFTLESLSQDSVINPVIFHVNQEAEMVEQLGSEVEQQTVSAEITSFSPYMVRLLGAGPDVLDNDGYPYGKKLNEGLTLDVKIKDGIDPSNVTFQWQKKGYNEPDTSYVDIAGATNKIYSVTISEYTANPTIIPDGGWFRCIVNGYESKAVQVVKVVRPSSYNMPMYEDFAGRKWIRPMNTKWYISNGHMAYSISSQNYFDLAGQHTINGVTYMMQTTCVGQSQPWRLRTSSDANPSPSAYNNSGDPQLDDTYFRFSDTDSDAVYYEADLKDGQRSLAIEADTMVGDYNTTRSLTVLEVLKDTDNTFKAIAIVGAPTIDAITSETPAFVMMPVVKTDLQFWIGDYNIRQVFAYNTRASNANYIADPIKINGVTRNDIITKVSGVHSGLSMSWSNIPSGGTVLIRFGVGFAENILVDGAGTAQYDDEVIENLPEDATYHITIGNNPKEYEFHLDPGETTIRLEGTDDNGESYSFLGKNIHIFNKAINSKKDLTIAKRPVAVDGEQEIQTVIADTPAQVTMIPKDPTQPNSVIVNVGTGSVLPHKYCIFNDNTTTTVQPTDNWEDPTAGKVTFTGLTSGTEYYVKSYIPAKTYEYPQSAVSNGIKVETNSVINLTENKDIVIEYDGYEHDFSVTAKTNAPTDVPEILYSYDLPDNYGATLPKYTDVTNGPKRIYYRVKCDGYLTMYGSYTVTIKPKAGADEVRQTRKLSREEDPTDEIEGIIEEYKLQNLGVNVLLEDQDNDEYLYIVKKNNFNDWQLKILVLRKAPHRDETRDTDLLEHDANVDFRVYADRYLTEVNEPGARVYQRVGGAANEFTVSGDDYEDYTLTIVEKRKDPPPPEPEPEPEPTPTPVPQSSEPPIVFDLPENIITKPTARRLEVVEEPEPVEETRTTVLRRQEIRLADPEAEVVEEPLPEPGRIMVSMKLADSTKTNAALVDAEAVVDTIFTEEEKDAIYSNGTNVEIKVEASPMEESSIKEEDKQAVEQGFESYAKEHDNLTIGSYMDISMFMRVDENDWNQIDKVNDDIEITIDIPEELRGLSNKYYVLRVHGSESALLDDLDADEDTITIATNLFSTYVLLYEKMPEIAEEPIEEPICHVCHRCPTFLGICYYIWLLIILGVITIIIVAAVTKDDKKKEKEATEKA